MTGIGREELWKQSNPKLILKLDKQPRKGNQNQKGKLWSIIRSIKYHIEYEYAINAMENV